MKHSAFGTLLNVTALTIILGVAGPAYAACSDDPGPDVDWKDCRKRNLILSGYDFQRADFSMTDLFSTDMTGANLRDANLTKAILTRAKLNSVQATQANFSKVIAGRTDFSGSDLAAANFEKAELPRSDFSDANLENVDFNRSELGRSNFTGATLTNPNFSFANLARVDFRNARIEGEVNVKGAYLLNTRFEGVDLTQFLHLAQWQVDMICGDENTILSVDLKRPDSWPCLEDE